jgi:HlyD family secretion protein
MNHFCKLTGVSVFVGFSSLSCGLHDRPTIERKANSGPVAALGGDTTAARVVAPGIVEPWGQQVDVSGQEAGWLAEIAVAEGDSVTAGQVLAKLDDELQSLAVKEAAAFVVEAKANLSRLQRGATTQEVKQAQAAYEAAAARGELAQSSKERTVRLHEGGVVPETSADRALAEAKAQLADTQQAEARLAEIRQGPRSEDRFAARARLDAAEVRLERTKVALERRTIKAPRAGLVLRSRFHIGEYYEPGRTPLVVIGDLSRMQLRLEVDEIDIPAVKVGAKVAVLSDSGELLEPGIVSRLAPSMGRRGLPTETPTARADVRVREVFVEVPPAPTFVPGLRLWGHVEVSNDARLTEVSAHVEGQ